MQSDAIIGGMCLYMFILIQCFISSFTLCYCAGRKGLIVGVVGGGKWARPTQS